MLQIGKSLILDLSILIDFYAISKEIFKFVDDLSIIMNVSDVTFQKFYLDRRRRYNPKPIKRRLAIQAARGGVSIPALPRERPTDIPPQ